MCLHVLGLFSTCALNVQVDMEKMLIELNLYVDSIIIAFKTAKSFY